MAKPILLVTRKLPEAIEARRAQDYDARLNPQDALWGMDGAEIARRATEASAAGILGAAGDRFDSVCINALPPSTKLSNGVAGFAADRVARDRGQFTPSQRAE